MLAYVLIDIREYKLNPYVQDLLYVISYGPSQVKPPAVQMLFHYWPNLKPPGAISEYRGLQYTGQTVLLSHLLLVLSLR